VLGYCQFNRDVYLWGKNQKANNFTAIIPGFGNSKFFIVRWVLGYDFLRSF